jgi:hypothetical protein
MPAAPTTERQRKSKNMDIPAVAGEEKQRLYERLYVAAEDLGLAR